MLSLIIQFVLEVDVDDCEQTSFATLTAVFGEKAIENFRFTDVDRLLIVNLPAACLSEWVNGEVDLANRRAVAHSDPVVGQNLMIVSAPIIIVIAPAQKSRFADAICRVTNRHLPTSRDPLRFLSTDGPRRTHIGDLVMSLGVAGIDSVTALSYGQKARIENYAWLYGIDVGRQSAHGTVVELDVGVNTEPFAGHESSVILVRDGNSCVWPGTTRHFPMFWELASTASGQPFGTFLLTSTRERDIRKVTKYQSYFYRIPTVILLGDMVNCRAY